MEENKLSFYNMGRLEDNKIIFKSVIKNKFGIQEPDLEKVVGGFKFLYCSEANSYVRVEFVDNGCQLKTTIIGELAEDVIEVYKAFASRFCD